MTKKEIRAGIRQLKKAFGAERLKKMSIQLNVKLLTCPEFQNAKIVMLYYPLWDEVDTRSMIKKSLEMGKRVILPTVVGDDIVPVEVTTETEWVKGPFDIMEPVAAPYEGTFDFILVPGVAFDHAMNRLGRGKGYYDRFLSQHPDSYRLGVCFNFQIVQEVPVEPFDFKMNDLLVI